jgi:hypothetical protein
LFVPLVALAHAPDAREAAVIGQGSGMTTHALLGSASLQHVVTIEIEPEMIKASRLFYPANRRAFDDPRSSFAIDDARAYFAARRKQFDLIVSEPSNPWVSGVSGLFTTEFYGRVKGYLAPNGVFAQWLHLYEIDDGLVLGVIVALSKNFPTYSIFQISNRDILIVATAGPTLPTPDWSIFQSPGLANDLKRVWPITARTMETLRVADNRTLDPLVRMAGIANSDFYPTLDLNAERARFMKSAALGFAGLASGRVNFAAMVDRRPNGLGDSYAVVGGIPRLQAMSVAAALRNGDARGGPDAAAAAARHQMLVDEMATGRAPLDWHLWLQSVVAVEDALHGGMAGVVDSVFYASLRDFLARAHAPVPVRASIDFMHGLAAWDYGEASRAADPLLRAAASGEMWLDPDVLRDGAVMAKLRSGDRAGARDAFRLLAPSSSRTAADLRTRLLYSYIADATSARELAAGR